jgi:Uri superfamily endonuclease
VSGVACRRASRDDPSRARQVAGRARRGAPEPGADLLRKQPGTYILWLRIGRVLSVPVGRFGVLRFEPGSYAYVGSAFGPGGVAARLGRHLRGSTSLRWHIDYLRAAVEPSDAWVSYAACRDEHRWTEILRAMPGAQLPVPAFGASDCRCAAHLIWFAAAPAVERFARLAGAAVRRVPLPEPGCE